MWEDVARQDWKLKEKLVGVSNELSVTRDINRENSGDGFFKRK